MDYSYASDFEMIVHDAPDGIMMVDGSLTILELNQRICVIFNRPRESFIGKNLLETAAEFFDGQNLIEIQELCKRLIAGARLQLKFDLKFGRMHYDVQILSRPSSQSIFFIFRDNTEYHTTLKELKASEHRYKVLSQLTFEGIVIHKDGVVLDCNDSFLVLMGYRSEEVLGRSFLEWVALESDKQLMIGKIRARKRDPYTVSIRRKNGSVFIAEVEAKNTIYQGVDTRIAAIRDVTERKNAEMAVELHQQQLEQLVAVRTLELEASIKELEAFTYSVSHDLRTPLRAIAGFADFLEQDYHQILDEEGRRYIRVIADNAAKMDDLIVNLLRLSRAARFDPEYILINMAALARSMYMEVASDLQRQEFEFVVHEMPDVHGDLLSIKQLWSNLIDNALKYSSFSDRKRIEIGCHECTSDHVTYFIKDYGAGFNMEYKHKLFEVFQRLHKDSEFKGTGVGLAILKRIIDNHKGEIRAESELGKGAVFYFQLPVIRV
jgi:PAS domain S-box-containing protein